MVIFFYLENVIISEVFLHLLVFFFYDALTWKMLKWFQFFKHTSLVVLAKWPHKYFSITGLLKVFISLCVFLKLVMDLWLWIFAVCLSNSRHISLLYSLMGLPIPFAPRRCLKTPALPCGLCMRSSLKIGSCFYFCQGFAINSPPLNLSVQQSMEPY